MAPPITREETGFGSGETAASDPRVPGVPAYSAHGAGSITIAAPASNGNDAVVTYSLRVKHDTGGGYAVKGYVQADGTIGAGEVFRTLAAWGATIAVSGGLGLTDYIPYTFAASAKNELAVQSAYSSESAEMNTLPDVDYSLAVVGEAREVTTGNTIVSGTPTVTGSSVVTGEATQDALTEYYGNITISFVLVNDDSTTSRVVIEYSEDGSTWYTATAAAGSPALTGKTTSPAGVTHTWIWDSYEDAGKSELDTSVYLRVRPYDASPTGGDADTAVSTAAFALNNRPGKIAWETSDNRTFSKDTTPQFIAVIPRLRGGTKGFPEISIYRVAGDVLQFTRASVVSIAGYEYETAPSTWVAMTPAGIPDTAIDGVNRVRYTIQAADALAAAEYYTSGRMGETRDEG